jgi:glyoxylase-like metal-dependent hydrolase (beta-lactamase superfamily II)
MNQAKKFASQADLDEKQITFSQISEHAWAYTAEGDPNTGIIIGDDAVLVCDTQATPAMAGDVIRRIREVTDRPIKYVALTHYHAVRVLGGSAYRPQHIIASQDTYDLIVERGEQDKASEISRFPRLFRDVESVPAGLTWPTITFTGKMTLWLGKLEVQLLQLGRGHTKGDTVVWLPQERALLSGDLIEFDATPYAGDAYFKDWPRTLDNLAALNPLAVVPGRGAALTTPESIAQGFAGTRNFIAELYESVAHGAKSGRDLNAVYQDTFAKLKRKYGHWVIFDHCMPFDVSRAYDEATEFPDPRIWTAERDVAMWKALES